jgi:addiction module HigA family antidote
MIIIKVLIMETLPNVHPDEILLEEFLNPMNITAYKLSKDIGIPQKRTSAILNGQCSITADSAIRSSLYFGNSPKSWLGLQDHLELEEASKNKQTELNKIRKAGICHLVNRSSKWTANPHLN